MLDLLASDFRQLLQHSLALSVCLAAFLWGRGPERACAAVWLVFFEAAIIFYELVLAQGYRLTQVDGFLATIDAVAAILFVAIALNANRNYPLYIAAMQVVALTAHLARGMIETISPVAYAIMAIGPSWCQLFIFSVGLIRHVQRETKYGRYREWRMSKPSLATSPVSMKGR